MATLLEQVMAEAAAEANVEAERLRAQVALLSEKVGEIDAIRDELRRSSEARRIEIKMPGVEPRDMGRQHRQFAKLVKMMAARRLNDGQHPNIWLTGAPGGFKTTAVRQAFKALGVPDSHNEVISLSNQTSESKLIGFHNAHGEAVETVVQRIFTEGGGLLFDEIDNSNANAMTVINTVTSNEFAGFASGTAKRHPDCYFVAAGNTKGSGANIKHMGRNALDGATTNRYSFLHWEYDWDFVLDMLPERHHSFVTFVKGVSEVLEAKQTQSIVSPRQAFDGVAFLEAGFKLAEVKDDVLWSRITADDREACKQAGWK